MVLSRVSLEISTTEIDASEERYELLARISCL